MYYLRLLIAFVLWAMTVTLWGPIAKRDLPHLDLTTLVYPTVVLVGLLTLSSAWVR